MKIIFIKNEEEYEITNKDEKFGNIEEFSERGFSSWISYFEIFHNKFNKKIFYLYLYFIKEDAVRKTMRYIFLNLQRVN